MNNYGTILEGADSYYLISSSSSSNYNCSDTIWHTGHNTSDDYYILNLDMYGSLLWAKSYGGSGYDQMRAAIWDQRDNTIVITGSSTSNDYMVSGNPAGNGIWTIKVDNLGNLMWQKTIETSRGGSSASIAIKPDLGYVILGSTAAGIGLSDNLIFTVDNMCNVISDTVFGGSGQDIAASIFPYKSGYIATGTTESHLFTEGNNYSRRGNGDEFFISYVACCSNASFVQKIGLDTSELQLFPNPSKGFTRIVLPATNQNCTIKIMSATGTIIYEKKILDGEGTVELSTRGWAKGFYIVVWQNEHGNLLAAKLINN